MIYHTIPAPEAIEHDSDTMWAEFQDSVASWDNQFAPTHPCPIQHEQPIDVYVPVISPEEDPFRQ